MPITANVTNEQITASVGETQIDVTVSGGVGPTGAAGASSWNDITGKPSTFAPSAHAASHAVNGDDELEIEGGQVRIAVDSENASTLGQGTVAATFLHTANATGLPTALPIATANARGAVRIGSGVSIDGNGVISVSTNYAASSHAHGSITNAGAIGTTSGLIVTTGASGVLGTLAMGTAGQVLKINSGASGVEWGAAAADVSIDTTAADVLSASSGSITADDPGADRLVFWDDSAGKLTHLTAGTGLSITDTTLTASVSASDISAGTLAYARMADPTVTSPSQITGSQNDYASFARGINRFTTNGAYNLTGMAAGSDGEVRVLTNVGSTAANTLTIKDQSSSSTAANRFAVPWQGDCVIPSLGSVVVYYDGTTQRWRVV